MPLIPQVTTARLLIYADNEELLDPAVNAAVQTLIRMSGFACRVENPHFLGEMLDDEAVQAVSTPPHMDRVRLAARTTLFKTGKEIRVGPLFVNGLEEAIPPPPAVIDGAGVPLMSFLKAPPTAGPTRTSALEGTLAGEGIEPLVPATAPPVPPVDISPITNPDAVLFDVAQLDSVSRDVAMAMKQRGWTSVGACRTMTQADLEALPGVGKRIAERILGELTKTLPPAPAAS